VNDTYLTSGKLEFKDDANSGSAAAQCGEALPFRQGVFLS
jgi:hypothetical protein